MVSGQRPFQSEHDQAVIYSILKEEPRLVFRPGREIPAQLETIIHKCLEKDPRNRYQDAEAVVEALKSFEKPAQNGHKPSIAVLPFVDMSPLKYQEYFCDGILAQSLDPLMPLFYAFSVGIHWSVGKPDDAISEFERAVEMDPHSGLAYFHVGVAYVLKRETEKAIAALQRSKELAVYSGWADGWLGLIHISEGGAIERKPNESWTRCWRRRNERMCHP
jgi:tetratricopeptide (TPR) repeat protein